MEISGVKGWVVVIMVSLYDYIRQSVNLIFIEDSMQCLLILLLMVLILCFFNVCIFIINDRYMFYCYVVCFLRNFIRIRNKELKFLI